MTATTNCDIGGVVRRSNRLWIVCLAAVSIVLAVAAEAVSTTARSGTGAVAFQSSSPSSPCARSRASFAATNTCLMSSSSSSPATSAAKDAASSDEKIMTRGTKKTLRVLALHGSGGNGPEFQKIVESWGESLASLTSRRNGDDDDVSLLTIDVTTVTAPMPKDDGRAWWIMPPGVRSSTADRYEGFEESCGMVLEQIQGKDAEQFDLIVGHSQGAILIASLLALRKIDVHPTLGYVMNGVAWPNPYTEELESLRFGGGGAISPPDVLVVVGDRDRINTPEQSARVQDALRNAGCDVQVVAHPRGHSVPTEQDDDDEAVASVMEWIASKHKQRQQQNGELKSRM